MFEVLPIVSLCILTSTVYKIIFAPFNFRSFTHANSFAPFWIHPDTVMFQERKFETLEITQSAFACWQRGQKQWKSNMANIALKTVYLELSDILKKNCSQIGFEIVALTVLNTHQMHSHKVHLFH